MNTKYLLRYRYVNDNPQGLFNIDYLYNTLEDARQSAEIYKQNAANPIILKIIKREYGDEEIEII